MEVIPKNLHHLPGSFKLPGRSTTTAVNPKILYTAFDVVPSPKGASTHITYFTQGLVAAGYGVTLITAGTATLPAQETYAGATLLRTPPGDDPNFLQRALDFCNFVMAHVAAAEPYDVVHVRSIWSGFSLAQAKTDYGYKLLYEVNGLPSIEMKYHYPALRGAPALDKIREQELATLHLADAVICPSQVTASYLTSLGVAAEKITVIPNGIDSQLFRPPAANLSKARIPEGHKAAQSLISNNQSPLPTLLYLGTLADWQGIDTLIAALPVVLAENPVRLRLVGPGRKPQLKSLQKRLRKLGLEAQVSLEPPVPHDQTPALIAQADICVAPLGYNDRNVNQGCCPIKILEYMACGRPIIAADLPVVRELVSAGREALLFSPDDPADLARQILAVLADSGLAATLGANAAARAHQCFTWSMAQARLESVYQRLLCPSRVADTN
jgi:glycosyltransferase involved in cell wall biosynthesis